MNKQVDTNTLKHHSVRTSSAIMSEITSQSIVEHRRENYPENLPQMFYTFSLCSSRLSRLKIVSYCVNNVHNYSP